MAHVLITGATGMIGKGVLLECLEHPEIDKITLINRSPLNVDSPKVRELLIKDFTQIGTLKNQLEKIDACFHCMGVSAVGMSEEDYTKLTYEVTKVLADVCFENNPNMTFNYVSGVGTDSSEKGRIMWARVKGKTENYVLNRGYENALMFRPGMIIPEKGTKSKVRLYNSIYVVMRPFFPLFKKMKSTTTTVKIGDAMIHSLLKPSKKNTILDPPAINQMAEL